ncbi:MAG: hypothetical protein ACRD3W_26165 [Terriglobales bacterium]
MPRFSKRALAEAVLTTLACHADGPAISAEDNPKVGHEVTDPERCNPCGQPLVEIDNQGQRLKGCLTCNLWVAEGKEYWVRLSEEDLRAIHHLRHKGSR